MFWIVLDHLSLILVRGVVHGFVHAWDHLSHELTEVSCLDIHFLFVILFICSEIRSLCLARLLWTNHQIVSLTISRLEESCIQRRDFLSLTEIIDILDIILCDIGRVVGRDSIVLSEANMTMRVRLIVNFFECFVKYIVNDSFMSWVGIRSLYDAHELILSKLW